MRLGYLVDRRPLAIPAYRRLWIASVIGAVGGSFSVITVPAQLYALTGSSATVGAAGGASFVALVVGALSAGAFADVADRRLLLLAAHCGLAATYAVLWAQTVLGARSVALLLVLVACEGLTFGAIMAVTGAAVPRVVPAELLTAASSLSSLVRYTGAIVGPLLGGVLIPLTGFGTLYLLDAVALVAAIWAIVKLPPIRPLAATPARLGAALATLRPAFRYLLASRTLTAVLAIDLAAMVLGMPVALFPELAQRGYGGPTGGGVELGSLYAAYPAGVFAAGLLSGTFTRLRRHGAVLASAATVWGITVMMLGWAPQLWLGLVALVLGGAANCLLSAFRNAITQAHTDDALRGRIQGTLTVVLIGGPQLANLIHGWAGATFGVRPTIWAGGLLTVVTVVAIVRLVPQLLAPVCEDLPRL